MSSPTPPKMVSTARITRHSTGSVFVARPIAAHTPHSTRPCWGRTSPYRLANAPPGGGGGGNGGGPAGGGGGGGNGGGGNGGGPGGGGAGSVAGSSCAPGSCSPRSLAAGRSLITRS